MYPIIAVEDEAMMNGARVFCRSEIIATVTVSIVARAYGGTVSSCALAAVYPRSVIMVG